MLILLILVLACCAWAQYCNSLTCKQKTALVRARRDSPQWKELSDEYSRVSYNLHMWHLMIFRDPKKLYGPLTQEIWPK